MKLFSSNIIPEPKKDKKRLFMWVSWASSVLLLGIMLRIVPLREVWQAMLLIQPGFMLAGMLIVIIHLRIRGDRWALMLRSNHHISGQAAAIPIIIGLAVNGILPGKIGELVRIGLASRRFKISIPFATMAAISDRLFDAITLLGLLGLTLAFFPEMPPATSVSILSYDISSDMLSQVIQASAFSVFALSIVIAGCLFSPSRTLLMALLKRLPFIGKGLQKRMEEMLSEALQGVHALKDVRRCFRIFFLSLGIWLLLAGSTQLLAWGMPGIHLSFSQALMVTVLSIAFSSIPSVPGNWGVFEAGTLLAIATLGIPCEMQTRLAFAFLLHLSFYLPTVLLGSILLLRIR